MRTKHQIKREALAIIAEFVSRYPMLELVPIRVSGRMTRAAGMVRFRGGSPFEIALSLPFFADEANNLRNTVTHEAAHAVAGHAAGHGPTWKAIHRAMGGTAKRCHTMNLAEGFTARRDQPKARVAVPCSKCGQPMMLGPTQAARARRGTRYTHKQCPR
jgi:hypothetical protein